MNRAGAILGLVIVLALAGCSESGEGEGGRSGRGGPPGGRPDGGAPGGAAAVPVETASVKRRAISSYIETNGALEAENEVDVVARASGPIVELNVEEGDRVRGGQQLARIDDTEYRAQLEIAEVGLNETRQNYERADKLIKEGLISPEEYESALAAYDSARAQVEASRIQLGYTEIRAPFDGLIITRYVDFAQQLSVNTPLVRLSDFDPLLCPIQVPERELRQLHIGQQAYLTVEPWPEERFEARVLRVSPVVNAATGTIKVTLEVEARNKLRPGMFARVFVQTDSRPAALVVPKSALSLESIGDTVYVVDGGVASRREVELGFREGDFVEIVSGVSDGEPVVVVGQDGLSDGTPVQVLTADSQPVAPPAGAAVADAGRPPLDPSGSPAAASGEPAAEGAARAEQPAEAPAPGRGGRRPDFSAMTPEQLERAKEFMRQRGMTEEQIEERIRRGREQSGPSESR